MIRYAAPLFAFLTALPALAAPLLLTPSDPQPDASDLSPGLAVVYAYPSDVRTLKDAESALRKGRAGPALKGLSYENNAEGDLTLTSRTSTKVAAAISGFIRFDAPGTFAVNVISNDGVVARIGGQQVALYDEIHGCEPAGSQDVEVPEAGWYVIEATYFQRKGTACLMMDWNVDGKITPVPDAAFAHSE